MYAAIGLESVDKFMVLACMFGFSETVHDLNKWERSDLSDSMTN